MSIWTIVLLAILVPFYLALVIFLLSGAWIMMASVRRRSEYLDNKKLRKGEGKDE